MDSLTFSENRVLDINSGLKVVDKLVKTHGISNDKIDNAFQTSIYVPGMTRPGEVRQLIAPFDLRAFPHALWLAMQKYVPQGMGMSIHRFSLPHIDQVLCWVLVNNQGKIIEKAYPVRKPQYVQAAKALINALLGR